MNPTQFDNPDDLKKYPDRLEQDLLLAKTCGVDAVLLPRYDEIYADGFRYAVDERHFSKTLCGRSPRGALHRSSHRCDEVAEYR